MNTNQIKIMIVEDEVLVGMMLARKLRSYGYDVGEVATTGEEALQRAGDEHPQVILMDVTLAGEINGIEAAGRIKKAHNIPIIIFSGYDSTLISKQTEDIEPVAILSKMGPIADIASAIEKAING